MKQPKPSYFVGGKAKWYSHSEKIVAVIIKINIHLPNDSAISLPAIYPKDTKACAQSLCKLCILSLAALFIVAKKCNKSYLSKGGWINKTGVYSFNGIPLNNKNEMNYWWEKESTWINLKRSMPMESNRSQEIIYCMFPWTWHSGKGKTLETGYQPTGARIYGWRKSISVKEALRWILGHSGTGLW